MNKRELQRGNANLLALARLLDKVPDDARNELGDPAYCQTRYIHPCGSPACALGHWALSHPSRWSTYACGTDSKGAPMLSLRRKVTETQIKRWKIYGGRAEGIEAAQVEFGLTYREASELFGGWGCGSAETASAAAKYIRRFVRRRQEVGYAPAD